MKIEEVGTLDELERLYMNATRQDFVRAYIWQLFKREPTEPELVEMFEGVWAAAWHARWEWMKINEQDSKSSLPIR